jgi:hypothetical protein
MSVGVLTVQVQVSVSRHWEAFDRVSVMFFSCSIERADVEGAFFCSMLMHVIRMPTRPVLGAELQNKVGLLQVVFEPRSWARASCE